MKLADFPKIFVSIIPRGGSFFETRLSLADAFLTDAEDPQILTWLRHYSQKKSFPFTADLSHLPPFLAHALSTLSEVPFGQTLSYQQLASKSGRPRAFRAAASACRRNPFPLFIPCHRVISSDGSLGGFAFGLEIKRRLLQFEHCQ